MTVLHIEGARTILADDIVETAVTIAEGHIVAVGGAAPVAARRLDGRGLVLAPALIDIHGDAFERQVMPRPDVFFPMQAAILETDRQLAANGIATAYHALTLSWEPGLRSLATAEAFIAALAVLAPRLTVENRVQLRWETFALDAVGLIRRALSGPLLPALAFNDHTTMSMRAIGMPVTERPFVMADTDVADSDDPRLLLRLAGNARRAGVSADAYLALLAGQWERRDEVAAAVAAVATMGRAAGAPMLSHDDSQPEMRRHFAGLGAGIAEFPMCAVTARDARARGEPVVLGAPNVVRGGSHIGSLDAAAMIEAGDCDILASDYFYPAMLAAVARLWQDRRAPLPRLWALVSAHPARALGLGDRGVIAPGKRADLVLVDWPEGQVPSVRLTLSAGRVAHLSGALPG